MTHRSGKNPCAQAPHRLLFTRLLLAALLVMSPLLGQTGMQSAAAPPGLAASADGGHPPCHGAGGAHDTERAAAGCAHCDGSAPMPGCQCCDLGAPSVAPPPTATVAAPLADGQARSSRLPDGMPPSPAQRLFRPPIATA
jgi:hypothetical protein